MPPLRIGQLGKSLVSVTLFVWNHGLIVGANTSPIASRPGLAGCVLGFNPLPDLMQEGVMQALPRRKRKQVLPEDVKRQASKKLTLSQAVIIAPASNAII